MSQGELRKGHGADSRLAEAADRLRNRIEAHKRAGGTRSAAVSRTEDIRQIESAEAEAYAKETGLWIPIEVTIDDLRPRNVLKDANGTFYIIDAGLKRNL